MVQQGETRDPSLSLPLCSPTFSLLWNGTKCCLHQTFNDAQLYSLCLFLCFSNHLQANALVGEICLPAALHRQALSSWLWLPCPLPCPLCCTSLAVEKFSFSVTSCYFNRDHYLESSGSKVYHSCLSPSTRGAFQSSLNLNE